METAEPIAIFEIQPSLSPWRLFWQRLKPRKIAMTGGVILIVLYSVAIVAGFIAPYRYDEIHDNAFFHPPVWPRLSGLHLVVPRLQQMPGDFVYQNVSSDTKPLHFFIHGAAYKLL